MGNDRITSGFYGLGLTGTFSAALRWQKSCQLNPTEEPCVSFRKRPKRIKGGVVKVVNQGSQRTSL